MIMFGYFVPFWMIFVFVVIIVCMVIVEWDKHCDDDERYE